MLQETTRICRAVARLACAGLIACAVTYPADPPTVPLTVCEVLRDLPAQDGKDVAVLGRYSFRENGRWVAEEKCSPVVPPPLQIMLIEDLKDAPKMPENFELDGQALSRKFADVQRRTQLGKFRFGTPDYDRWAVIYGRVEARKGEEGKKAAANLVIRGSGVIIRLTLPE